MTEGTMVHGLTQEELTIVNKLAEAWNAFISLPAQHTSDVHEFMTAIHVAQNIILVRPVFRDVELSRLSITG